MSPPEPNPSNAAPDPGPWAEGGSRERARAARVAADRLTTLMLVATVGVIAAAWIEPIGRTLEGPQAPAARRGIAELVRSRGWATLAPEATGHPRIRGGALDPDSFGAGHPLPPRERDALLELLAPDDDRLGQDDPVAVGKLVVREAFELRDRASDDARVLGMVKPGSRVRVVRHVGEWLLLAVPDGGRATFGWVRREQLNLP